MACFMLQEELHIIGTIGPRNGRMPECLRVGYRECAPGHDCAVIFYRYDLHDLCNGIVLYVHAQRDGAVRG